MKVIKDKLYILIQKGKQYIHNVNYAQYIPTFHLGSLQSVGTLFTTGKLSLFMNIFKDNITIFILILLCIHLVSFKLK